MLLGGTHPQEVAGHVAATLVVENVRVKKGRLIVIPQANRRQNHLHRTARRIPAYLRDRYAQRQALVPVRHAAHKSRPSVAGSGCADAQPFGRVYGWMGGTKSEIGIIRGVRTVASPSGSALPLPSSSGGKTPRSCSTCMRPIRNIRSSTCSWHINAPSRSAPSPR